MSKIPKILPEPTMNDVLTSLREIIQENCSSDSKEKENFSGNSQTFQENEEVNDFLMHPLSNDQKIFFSQKNNDQYLSSSNFESENQSFSDRTKEDRFDTSSMPSDYQENTSEKFSVNNPPKESMNEDKNIKNIFQQRPFFKKLSDEHNTSFSIDDEEKLSPEFTPSQEEDFKKKYKINFENILFQKLKSEDMDKQLHFQTEDLLRAFISQWLDKNFTEIFNKVLREELRKSLNK